LSPILYLVSTAHFFNDVYMGFLTPLYPIVMDKFGLSLSLVGAVSMVAALGSALSQPFFGILFDRFGASASLYLAPLLTGLLVSCLGITPSFTLFLVVLCLGCLGSAAFHPKGASVTPALSGGHPEVGMAVFSAGGNLGYAAGPAIIAYFISTWGFRATPILAVPAALVAGCLALLLPAGELRKRTARSARISFRELAANRGNLAILARLVFINFCLTVGVRGLGTFLPVYMAQHGSRVTSIGILFTGMLALGALASVFVSTLSRRTGKKGLIMVSAAAGGPLAVAGYLFFPSPVGIALIVIAGTVLTFTSPLLILMAQKHSGNSPAMASSLIMGLSWGLAGLAMVPMGALGEALGMNVMMVIAGGFPLLAVVSCLRIPRD
jgi:FSR family fosmidomycin resistance protein-like MFS transporter